MAGKGAMEDHGRCTLKIASPICQAISHISGSDGRRHQHIQLNINIRLLVDDKSFPIGIREKENNFAPPGCLIRPPATFSS